MGERPRGLNPEELFGDLEQDSAEQEGSKPLYDDLSVEKVAKEAVAESRFDSETSRTAKAEAEIREMRKQDAEGAPESVEVDLSELEEADAAAETETGEPEVEIEVEEEGAPEGKSEDGEIPIEVAGSDESLEAIGGLYDRLRKDVLAGQEPSPSDLQRLLGEMAEQAALDKYGTTEPLDNITDSQGNRVDFWTLDNSALDNIRKHLQGSEFRNALELVKGSLDRWVPEFKKVEPVGQKEKPPIEIQIDDRDLANRQRELEPVMKALKKDPDSAVNDSLVAQAFRSTADYLTMGNDRITAALMEVSENLPDESARGSLEQAKRAFIDRLAENYPNAMAKFRSSLEQGNVSEAVALVAGYLKNELPKAADKLKGDTERAKTHQKIEEARQKKEQDEGKRAARQRAQGFGTARKETPKKSLLNRMTGWFRGKKAA